METEPVKIVIPNQYASMVGELEVVRAAKANLEKQEKALTKKLKQVIDPFIEEATFEVPTLLVVQDTDLAVKLTPNKGRQTTDYDKLAELVEPEIIRLIVHRKPYHAISVVRV